MFWRNWSGTGLPALPCLDRSSTLFTIHNCPVSRRTLFAKPSGWSRARKSSLLTHLLFRIQSIIEMIGFEELVWDRPPCLDRSDTLFAIHDAWSPLPTPHLRSDVKCVARVGRADVHSRGILTPGSNPDENFMGKQFQFYNFQAMNSTARMLHYY